MAQENDPHQAFAVVSKESTFAWFRGGKIEFLIE